MNQYINSGPKMEEKIKTDDSTIFKMRIERLENTIKNQDKDLAHLRREVARLKASIDLLTNAYNSINKNRA